MQNFQLDFSFSISLNEMGQTNLFALDETIMCIFVPECIIKSSITSVFWFCLFIFHSVCDRHKETRLRNTLFYETILDVQLSPNISESVFSFFSKHDCIMYVLF